MLLHPRILNRLLIDTQRTVSCFLLYLMFLVLITLELLITLPTSSSLSPRERSLTETSSSEPTGPRMLEYMNSPWELPELRLRDVTLMFTYSRMESGRSPSTIPLSCLTEPSRSQLMRLRSRISSSSGTLLWLPKILMLSLSVTPARLSCSQLYPMF